MTVDKELILATKDFAKEDRKLSWMHLITTMLVMAGGYVGVFLETHLIINIVCALLISLVSVRVFIIYHDYLHKAILQKSWVANLIFTLFGWYILVPRSIWKRSHDYHHKHNSKLYTSSIGSFPIVTKKKFLSVSRAERAVYLFIRHPLTIAMGYIFAFAYGMCLRSLMRSPDKHWDSALSLIFHFGMGYLIYFFFGFHDFLFAFMIPALISSAMGSYLFYAQHNFPDATFEDKEGWTYIGAAMNSSSYMKMNRVMHWFTGNIGYHHIHHVNARIPFYRLPEIYKKIPAFQNSKDTSLSPLDIIKCFRVKVWDPEKRKMIGLKEIYAK